VSLDLVILLEAKNLLLAQPPLGPPTFPATSSERASCIILHPTNSIFTKRERKEKKKKKKRKRKKKNNFIPQSPVPEPPLPPHSAASGRLRCTNYHRGDCGCPVQRKVQYYCIGGGVNESSGPQTWSLSWGIATIREKRKRKARGKYPGTYVCTYVHTYIVLNCSYPREAH
jgi:hypothetical protein